MNHIIKLTRQLKINQLVTYFTVRSITAIVHLWKGNCMANVLSLMIILKIETLIIKL